MTTLDKIEMDGISVIEKLKRGDTLNSNDRIVLKAYNTLHGGTLFGAGKKSMKNRVKKGY